MLITAGCTGPSLFPPNALDSLTEGGREVQGWGGAPQKPLLEDLLGKEPPAGVSGPSAGRLRCGLFSSGHLLLMPFPCPSWKSPTRIKICIALLHSHTMRNACFRNQRVFFLCFKKSSGTSQPGIPLGCLLLGAKDSAKLKAFPWL